MSDREHPAHRLIVECHGDSIYVVEDTDTGIRLAGRDFESVKSAVLNGAAHLPKGDAVVSNNVRQSSASRPTWLAPLADLPRALVLFAPLLLGGLLLVASLRPYAQLARLVPEGGGVFRTLRVTVLEMDQALRGMDPRKREELLTSIRSIVESLKPFADEIRPLFEEGLGRDDAKNTGQSGPKGARLNP
jgi:hypothetical protein